VSLYDDLLRPFKVVKHRAGQSLSSATEIFNENDASVFVDVSCTKDGKVMLVSKNSKSSSEVFALNTGLFISDKPRCDFRCGSHPLPILAPFSNASDRDRRECAILWSIATGGCT
jgi:hypothetical protein